MDNITTENYGTHYEVWSLDNLGNKVNLLENIKNNRLIDYQIINNTLYVEHQVMGESIYLYDIKVVDNSFNYRNTILENVNLSIKIKPTTISTKLTDFLEIAINNMKEGTWTGSETVDYFKTKFNKNFYWKNGQVETVDNILSIYQDLVKVPIRAYTGQVNVSNFALLGENTDIAIDALTPPIDLSDIEIKMFRWIQSGESYIFDMNIEPEENNNRYIASGLFGQNSISWSVSSQSDFSQGTFNGTDSWRGIGQLELASTIFQDGFEDGDILEWSGDTGSFSVQTSTLFEGSYSVQANTSSYQRIGRDILQNQPGYISYNIYSGDSSNRTCEIRFSDSLGGSAQLIINIQNGEIQYYDGSSYNTVQSASSSTWYNIELKNIDYANSQADIWVDGVEQVVDAQFLGDFSNSQYIVLISPNTNTGSYWDSIQVGGYVSSGTWTSQILENSEITSPQQISSFETTTSIGADESVKVRIGVDEDNDSSIEMWSHTSGNGVSLSDGTNTLGDSDFNLPSGYRYSTEFNLSVTDSSTDHTPSVSGFDMVVENATNPTIIENVENTNIDRYSSDIYADVRDDDNISWVALIDNSDDTVIENNIDINNPIYGLNTTWSGLDSGTSYQYYIQVSDSLGDVSSSEVYQFTTDSDNPPSADFTHNAPKLTGESVNFDASNSTDDYSISTYEWDFDNDGTYEDIGKTVTHSYSDDGTYTVELQITDDGGQTDTVTKDVTINNRSPTADFSYSVTISENKISVDASDSSDSDGTVDVYEWKWENSLSYVTGSEIDNHIYDSLGTYQVSLKITDDDGATDTVEKTIDLSNNAPTADFSYSVTISENKISVDASDSNDSDGTVENYEWKFTENDTFTYGNITTSHIYENRGTYQVSLRVTDDVGATDTVIKIIDVTENATVDDDEIYTPDEWSIWEKSVYKVRKTIEKSPTIQTFFILFFVVLLPIGLISKWVF
jgi:hypothetical protein